jgi:hypothetical protein
MKLVQTEEEVIFQHIVDFDEQEFPPRHDASAGIVLNR